MLVYADSSALIKRVVEESESDALVAALDVYIANADTIVTSSLTWVELGRALGTLRDDGHDDTAIREAIDVALSGVAERPLTADVLSLARRVGPTRLRSLDAIHLATAILLDADVVLTYDDRLAAACHHNALAVAAPGPKGQTQR